MIIRNVNTKTFKQIEDDKDLWAKIELDGTIEPDAIQIKLIRPDGEHITGFFKKVILDSLGLR